MPLLRGEPFKPVRVPATNESGAVDPNKPFFYFKVTKETFSKHEEYFDRYIECFSNIWTCEYTGAKELTYDQAFESEQKFLREYNPQNIAQVFKKPVLALLKIFNNTENNYNALAQKIFKILDMFLFPNEQAEVRKFAQSDLNKNVTFTAKGVAKNELNSSLLEQDWGKRTAEDILQALLRISYSIASEKFEQTAPMKTLKLLNRTNKQFSEGEIKIFIAKRSCIDPETDCIKIFDDVAKEAPSLASCFPISDPRIFKALAEITDQTLKKYGLGKDKPLTPIKNGGAKVSYPKIDSYTIKKPKQPQFAQTQKQLNGTAPKTSTNGTTTTKNTKTHEQIKAENAEREAKEKERAAKKALLEKQRAEEKFVRDKYFARLNLPREDFLCEEMVPLSDNGVPIIQPIEPYSKNVLSYTDYLQIVELAEFLVTFRDQLDPMLVSEFEKGIDVSLIEYAVLDMNPNSSYGELLQCLLATILSQLTEQDKMTPKDDNRDLLHDLDDEDPIKTQISTAVKNFSLPQKLYGVSINDLIMDNCTLTEILRLHLITSGGRNLSASKSNIKKANGLLQYRDDPGIEFRNENPHINQFLETKLIFELEPKDKIKILTLLMHQILGTFAFRDQLTFSNEKYAETRAKLKEIARKESQLDKLESANAVKNVKIDNYIQNGNNSNKDNPGANVDQNSNKTSPSDQLNEVEEVFPPPLLTRQKDFDPNTLLEKIIDGREEFTRAKSRYIRTHFEEYRKVQNWISFNHLTGMRCFYLGMDRYLRHYYFSRFYDSIIIVPSDECFTQARKILSKYSDLSQKTKVHLKTKYFLDIDANLKVDNSLLWPRLQKGFEQADKEIAGLMKLGKIETKEAFEKLIKKLCHRGFRERSLKSSLQQRREMFTYVAMAPKIEREKTALLKDEEKNDEDLNSPLMTIEEKSQTKIENTKSEPLPQILTNGDLTEFSHAPKTENEINENKENNYHISESLSPKHENHSAAGQTKNTLLQYGQGLVISDILASFIDLEEKLTLGNLKLSDENVDRKMWPNWMPKCLMDELEISKNIPDNEFAIVTDEQVNLETIFTNMKALLIEISGIIDPDFVTEPLGISHAKRKKSQNLKPGDKIYLGTMKVTKWSNFYAKWCDNLQNCTSLSQMSLYFTILDRSIAWGRATGNLKCNTCKRKIFQLASKLPQNETEESFGQMMQCNACERVYHRGCLKKNRDYLQNGEWYCSSCLTRVIMRNPTPKKNTQTRRSSQLNNLSSTRSLKIQKSNEILSEDESASQNNNNSESESVGSSVNDNRFNTRPKRNKIEYADSSNSEDDEQGSKKSAQNEFNPNRKPTRAANNQTIQLLIEIIDSLKACPEAESFILSQHNESHPTDSESQDSKSMPKNFAELSSKAAQNLYLTPHSLVDGIAGMFKRLHDQYAENSNENMMLISLENKFSDLMAARGLSFFLE